jgi:superfamily II DNA/RNA helicase
MPTKVPTADLNRRGALSFTGKFMLQANHREAVSGFVALGLDQAFATFLSRLGITDPTPIQEQAIPVLLEGEDLIASAPTGTGKTAAFLLPALKKLMLPSARGGRGARVLVLTPTRELAQQVAKAAIDLVRGRQRCKITCITGGESYRDQWRELASQHEILVATPGRLTDWMERGKIDYGRIEVLVLDEADRMLDMGFADDVLNIAAQLPRERQTVCFTATLDRNVRDLAQRLLRSPRMIELAAPKKPHTAIEQRLMYADDHEHKVRLLCHWLDDAEVSQAVVFTATKQGADDLARELESAGHNAVALHGDLPQALRNRRLLRLRHGKARILVATDVAARGLDVPAVSHVFNFDAPRVAEDYIHRIGRTGRAGASGVAVTLVGRDDVLRIRQIERFTGQRIVTMAFEGLEPRFKPAPPRPPQGRRDGPRPHRGNAGRSAAHRAPREQRGFRRAA